MGDKWTMAQQALKRVVNCILDKEPVFNNDLDQISFALKSGEKMEAYAKKLEAAVVKAETMRDCSTWAVCDVLKQALSQPIAGEK